MSLNLSEKKTYTRIGEGTYPARVVRIIDFGMQVATDYKTGEEKHFDDGNLVIQHKVWIDFELPTERIEVDGKDKPRWIGKEYTLSAHDKAAIKTLLKAADPQGTSTLHGRNVSGLLDKSLMVSLGSTSGGKDKVVSVSPLMKGMVVAPLENPSFVFDLDESDDKIFSALPQWMQDKIKSGVGFEEKNSFESMKDSNFDGEESPY